MIRFLLRWLLTFILLSTVTIVALAGYSFYSFTKTEMDFSSPSYFTIKRGDDTKKVIDKLIKQGLNGESWQWILLTKIKKIDRSIKAGDYEIAGKTTPISLLDKLVRGEIQLLQFRIPEGVTFKTLRKLLDNNKSFTHETKGLSEDEIIALLGLKIPNFEGMLYPDTYRVIRNSSDLEMIRLAYNKQQQLLNELWESRATNIPLRIPYEALILASIVEKETGHPDDISLVASVYTNRLRVKMPLQADPTVIYGMGDKYKGNIRKKDLKKVTPYNTYVIGGLPPTPISTVSKASLEATLNPPDTDYYYFVAKGNGRSYFSKNLREHNNAVRKYILKR